MSAAEDRDGFLYVPEASKEPYAADVLAKLREDAEVVIAKYPHKRSALLPLLHLTQSVDGYVTGRAIAFCAEILDLSEAEVSGVATFYTQYKRHPNGEFTVGVCTNTLCAIMGGDEIFDRVSEHLGIGHDETTEDGKITLERLECNAACDYAPVVMGNWEFFDNQTPESTIQLVDDLRAGKDVKPTRGPDRLCTFKQVSRVLAGFSDGLADEGVGAGPASLLGLEIANDRGWLAPGADAADAERAAARAKAKKAAQAEKAAADQATAEKAASDKAAADKAASDKAAAEEAEAAKARTADAAAEKSAAPVTDTAPKTGEEHSSADTPSDAPAASTEARTDAVETTEATEAAEANEAEEATVRRSTIVPDAPQPDATDEADAQTVRRSDLQAATSTTPPATSPAAPSTGASTDEVAADVDEADAQTVRRADLPGRAAPAAEVDEADAQTIRRADLPGRAKEQSAASEPLASEGEDTEVVDEVVENKAKDDRKPAAGFIDTLPLFEDEEDSK